MASVSLDSDSDDAGRFQEEEDFDVDNMDFDLPSAPVPPASSGSAARQSSSFQPSAQQQAMLNSFAGPSSSTSYNGGVSNSRVVSSADAEKFKHYQTIYPIYIDAAKARKNGERRVSNAKAVRFPKAQEIAEVCGRFFGLSPLLEAEKTHPRDWANPGRVKVLLKDEKGRPVNQKIPDSELAAYIYRTSVA